MRAAKAFAVATLFLVAACRQQGAESAPDYRPTESGTVDHALCLLGFTAIPVREIGTGHHLIEATINGRTGTFVLDTGANMSVIDRSHLGDFGLSSRSGDLGGAIGIGAAGKARRMRVESFEIGPIDIRQNLIVTSDLGQLLTVLGRATGTTVNGIVGQDVLNEHRAIIDVERPMLYLMEADRDPAPVPAERCRANESTAENTTG